jgi:DNA primase large subunit
MSPQVSLSDLEQYADDRLDAFRALQSSDRWARARALLPDVERLLPQYDATDEAAGSLSFQKDCISHWAARLACCRSAELRSWLVYQEGQLLRHRLQHSSPSALVAVVDQWLSGLGYRRADEALLSRHADALAAVRASSSSPSSSSSSAQRGAASPHYLVPFAACLPLVARRQVLLSRGHAVVPSALLPELVIDSFRTRLRAALKVSARALPVMLTDPGSGPEAGRLAPLLQRLAARAAALQAEVKAKYWKARKGGRRKA